VKIFLEHNVYEGALARIRYLFNEFENLYVNFSGGKDSTVLLNLTIQVATEMGRLPVKAMFLDQECEWECVIEFMRRTAKRDEVEFSWLQVPTNMFNASSEIMAWNRAWEEDAEDKWVRPKEPDSIHENVYKEYRFDDLFEGHRRYHHPNEPCVSLAGVRVEESPARKMGLTSYPTYKHLTWGAKKDVKRGHYVMYPLYDWSYTDIWKAIHDGGWDYCRLYDLEYKYGQNARDMRVSNVHHETALQNVMFLQEFEPKTFNRITKRLSGLHAAATIGMRYIRPPRELPFMFSDWREYRDHLLHNLIQDEDIRERMRTQFEKHDHIFDEEIHDELRKKQIACILSNDYHGSAMNTFRAGHGKYLKAGKFAGGKFKGGKLRSKHA